MGSLGVATLGSEFDGAGLQRGLDKAFGSTNRFLSKWQGAWQTAAGFIISNVISKITGAIVKLGTELVAFTKESLFSAARVEELAIVNNILAKNAGLSEKAVADEAAEVKSMGIETAIAQKAVANFIRYNLDFAKASDLARVAQDSAVIAGKNSTDTFDALIHGITTLNPLVLRNAGIVVNLEKEYKDWAKQNKRTVDSLTYEEKQMIALNAVLAQGESVAGAYEAAMGSASKQFRSWPRYIDDLKVALGSLFQREFSNAIFSISGLLKKGREFFETVASWRDEGASWTGAIAEGLEKAFGVEARKRFVKFANTAEDIWKGIQKNDWNLLAQTIADGFVEATAWIRQRVAEIDWNAITTDIAAGIESIDWVLLGDKFGVGVKNILGSLQTIAQEANWGELLTAPIVAAGEFLAGWFASFWNIQTASSLQEALLQWQAFGEGLKRTVQSAFGALRGLIIPGLTGVVMEVAATGVKVAALIVTDWKTKFDTALRTIQKLFFARGQGAMTQLKLGIEGMVNTVITAIQKVIDQIQSSITGIVVPVAWGSLGRLNIPGGGGGGDGGGGSRGGGCFVAGTRVTMADYSRIPIEEIEPGQVVLSMDIEAGEVVHAEIESVFHHPPEDAPVLLDIDGLLATPEHRFYVQSGKWISAGDLVTGDVLINENGQPVTIRTIQEVPGDVPVYNLHTSHATHNYFANGILVHNAKAAQHGGVFSGPKSGYPGPIMHGEEGIVPLKYGAIPVALNVQRLAEALSGAAGAGTTNQFYFRDTTLDEQMLAAVERRQEVLSGRA